MKPLIPSLMTTLILGLLVQWTDSQCLTDNDTRVTAELSVRKDLYKGQLAFTLNLFNAINKEMSNDNVFFSPHSIYQTLLLAYFSSAHQTENALKNSLILGYDKNKVDVMQAYKLDKFERSLRNSSESYQFNSANKLYAVNNLPIRDCMLSFFGNEIERLNFQGEPDLARTYINEWIYNQTKHHIKDLIPEDGITAATKLVLVNAAYFKGIWKSKFLSDHTKREVFYTSPDEQTFVQMMKQKGSFNHGINEDLGAHVLELPYKGDDISMYILLPPFSNPHGIDEVIAKLNPEGLASVVEDYALMARQVEVQIPKFEIERTLELRNVLEAMGVGDLFEDTSDFSALTGKTGVHFDDAAHKAKIRVDEEGTVAVAATAIFSFRSSRPVEPTQFVCNHPFVYFLYDKPTNTVLFMGVYRNPKKV